MEYSDFSIEQISSPIYEKVAQKLLDLAEDEEIRNKVERYII